MNIKHHPSEDLIISYSAGDLGEAWSLLIATHLALCPSCRYTSDLADTTGGALMETLEPQSLSPDLMSKTMSAVTTPGKKSSNISEGPCTSGIPNFREPLRSYAGVDIDNLNWRRLGGDAFHIPLVKSSGGQIARLLKIPSGKAVPEHGHNGMELTMVLCGSFKDGYIQFSRGDVETASSKTTHQPIATIGEDCICLAVTDARLKFKSPLARLVQPFLDI